MKNNNGISYTNDSSDAFVNTFHQLIERLKFVSLCYFSFWHKEKRLKIAITRKTFIQKSIHEI